MYHIFDPFFSIAKNGGFANFIIKMSHFVVLCVILLKI